MGDFVSYNTYQPTEEDKAPLVQDNTVRQTGTVHSITINGGQATSSGEKHKHVSSADLSPYAAEDWRSTARDRVGFPTSNITADSVVEIGGMSAKVDVFVKAGILRETPEGFVMANAEQTQQGQQQQQQDQSQDDKAQGDDAATFPTGLDEAMNAAAEPFSQPVYDNGVALGIAHALGDIPLENVADGVARNSGMAPEDVAQRTEFIVNSFQAQADNFITGRLGVSEGDLQDFYDFARQPENKGGLRDALNGQLYGGSMAAWRPLVDRYFANTAPNSDALKARGFETKQGADGADLVRINGTWVSLKAAAKAGLI
ncbi:hypothetical protein [Ralstonia pseudosolanacearum]|uniref:hypothetical protein n=1 Tax=Ralstonia pseudosolanacearum TaxID=1310165 RepID=UPI003D2F1EBD